MTSLVPPAPKANPRRTVLQTKAHRQLFVDFYAPATRLVVEVDGSQHVEPDEAEHDKRRTLYLNQMGLQVLRYNDRQVLLELDSVLEDIFRAVEKKILLNPPLPKGELSRKQ